MSTGTYNAANHQLVFGSYNMLYDLNGNVTNIINGSITNKLVWNAHNQLTNMLGAVTANFLYDAFGRRVTRTVSSTTEKYVYDGLDTILQKDAAGTIAGRYFRGLGIDEPWLRSDIGVATTNRVYLADALGSIVALADTNRSIQTEYDYESFGTTTTTGAGNKNSYKFTGREDDGTGLYYYRARYYHPVLGRFVSEDPIEYGGGDLNLYAYVFGDPVNLLDPVGLDGWGGPGWGYRWLDIQRALVNWANNVHLKLQVNAGVTAMYTTHDLVVNKDLCVYYIRGISSDKVGGGVGLTLGVEGFPSVPFTTSGGVSQRLSLGTDLSSISANFGGGIPLLGPLSLNKELEYFKLTVHDLGGFGKCECPNEP